MITYNHEKYISQAVESVMSQKTNFDYQLIIGEDCSTDETRKIVIKYKKKYPSKIKLLLNEKNLGMMKNFVNALNACEAEYIAVCEGDDYWTDPNKLQKQVDFLDKNKDFSMATHNVDVLKANGIFSDWTKRKMPETISLEYILSHGSAGATCSLIYRNHVFGNFPHWFVNEHSGDWPLQILVANKGKLKYFEEKMGVYRKHAENANSAAIRNAAEQNESTFALPAKYGLELSHIINKHFNYQYEKLLRRSNIYWYLYYGKEYLKIGDSRSARKYSFKIIKEIFALKFWNVYSVYPQVLLLLIASILPNFLWRPINNIIRNTQKTKI